MNTNEEIKTFTVHRPNQFAAERESVLGRNILEAARGIKVGYKRDGYYYHGSFIPVRVEESSTILGGVGGFRVIGTADGQPTEVWFYRD